MNDYAKILWAAYERFLLSLGGKQVPTPYRMNEVGAFQKLGPEFQGKSSPEVLTETTQKLAKLQKFDLNKASVEQIQDFMINNKLGIDCSGFVYRILNYLVQEVFGKPLTSFGFEHVGRTNVKKLTSAEFTKTISKVSDIKPGDLIKLNSKKSIPHCLVVIEATPGKIVYAHSSEAAYHNGVHTHSIEITDPKLPLKKQRWLQKYTFINYDSKNGDGVRRLKFL